MDFYYKKTERYVSFANTGGKGIPNPARSHLLEGCLDYPFEEQGVKCFHHLLARNQHPDMGKQYLSLHMRKKACCEA